MERTLETLPLMTGKMMLAVGILATLLGIVMIAWPNATLEVGLAILGVICIIAGIVGLLISMALDVKMMIVCSILTILGLALLLVPHFIADLAAYMFALLLLIIGIGLIMGFGISVSYNKSISTAIGAIIVAISVIIFIFPGDTVKTAMWIFGAILVIVGVMLAFDGWKYRNITRL